MFSVPAFVHVRPSAHKSPSETVVPWAHWLVGSWTIFQVVCKTVTAACSVKELEKLSVPEPKKLSFREQSFSCTDTVKLSLYCHNLLLCFLSLLNLSVLAVLGWSCLGFSRWVYGAALSTPPAPPISASLLGCSWQVLSDFSGFLPLIVSS